MKTTEEILAWVDEIYKKIEGRTKFQSIYGNEEEFAVKDFIDDLREFIISEEER